MYQRTSPRRTELFPAFGVPSERILAPENSSAEGGAAAYAAASAPSSAATPEIDALNYAPRVRIPTLMLNARYDFDNPVDQAQRPLVELLGSAAEHKQHTVVESGHSIPIEDGAREILPWLDRYLGPPEEASTVTARTSAAKTTR